MYINIWRGNRNCFAIYGTSKIENLRGKSKWKKLKNQQVNS